MDYTLALPEDVEQLIASMCETRERNSLACVNRNWRYAVSLAEDFNDESLSVNGHVLSIASILQNGPVFMRCLKVIDLTNASPCELVYEALHALQIHKLRRRELSIYYNSDFCLDKQFLEFLASKTWTTALQTSARYHRINDQDVLLGARNVHLRAQHLGNYIFSAPLEKLEIIDDNFINQDQNVCQRAFSTPTKTLCLHGILTDQAMLQLNTLKRNPSIQTLELHFQGICTFQYAQCLQRQCPNIRSLKIRASNLTEKNLAYFDWTLWPGLKTLDFEHNYTLNTFMMPRGLEHLRIAFTGIRSLRTLYALSDVDYSGLTSLSIDASPLLDDTIDFMSAHSGLQRVLLNLKNFMPKTIDIQRWSMFSGLEGLELFFRQGLGINVFLNQIRKACPNVHVCVATPF
jgi:hypothetical protein